MESDLSFLKKSLETVLQRQEKETRHFFKFIVKLENSTEDDESEFSRMIARHKSELKEAISKLPNTQNISQEKINDFINTTIKARQSHGDVEKAFEQIEKEL